MAWAIAVFGFSQADKLEAGEENIFLIFRIKWKFEIEFKMK